MTYEPLHHKYRPQTFADLVGQEAIAQTLTNAVRQDRIAPAYLFTGPRGTGKTSSARILAKSLNCLSSPVPTPTPCGICDVCRGIAKGAILDVIEIDAASNTGVDNIRDLIERAQFAPVQCRYKVYVIDECHMLSVSAFNSLLKTLEEPPDRVVFVLATTDPQRVLPTIISRCQKFDFRRIPLTAMTAHLREIANNEAINIADDAVQMVAQLAQGGLRDAESLLDQLSLLAGEITVEKVWDLVGAVPEQDLMALLEAIASDQALNVLEITRRLLDRGREPLVVLQNLTSFYRDLLIAKMAPTKGDMVALTQQTWQKLGNFAQGWDLTLILAGQKHLQNCEAQIKNTTQPRLWLEITLLGLLPSALAGVTATASEKTVPSVHIQPLTPKTTPSEKPPVPTETVAPAAPPTPTPEPIQPSPIPSSESIASSPTPIDINASNLDLDAVWQQVLEQIQKPGTRTNLRIHARLQNFNGQMATIVFKKIEIIRMIETAIVKDAFQKVFNRPVQVMLVPESSGDLKGISLFKPKSDRHLDSELPPFNGKSPEETPNNPVPPAELPKPPEPLDPPQQRPEPLEKIATDALKFSISVPTPPPQIDSSPVRNSWQQAIVSEAENRTMALRYADAQAVNNAAEQLITKFGGEVLEITDEAELWKIPVPGLLSSNTTVLEGPEDNTLDEDNSLTIIPPDLEEFDPDFEAGAEDDPDLPPF